MSQKCITVAVTWEWVVYKSTFTQRVFYQNTISEVALSAIRKKGICEAEVLRDYAAYSKAMQIKFHLFEWNAWGNADNTLG